MAYKSEDVLTLAKAGFTAAQIAALATISAQPAPAQPAPAQPAPAQPAPAQPAPAQPAPAQPAPAQPAQDPLSQILAQLQLNAVNATQQPAAQSVDDILAEIINPPTKEGGK